MDGKTATGVTLFRLVEKMDAGPILAQATFPIGPETTSGELTENLALLGSQIFLKSLECLCGGYAEYIAQDDNASTLAPKIDKQEERIAWNGPCLGIHNKVRALNPAPGAYCVHSGKRLKVWRTRPVAGDFPRTAQVVRFEDGFPVVACASGTLILLEVQPEGRKITRGDEWARGSRVKEGDFLE
jgi:methionyl-tRNA formyltransferase